MNIRRYGDDPTDVLVPDAVDRLCKPGKHPGNAQSSRHVTAITRTLIAVSFRH